MAYLCVQKYEEMTNLPNFNVFFSEKRPKDTAKTQEQGAYIVHRASLSASFETISIGATHLYIRCHWIYMNIPKASYKMTLTYIRCHWIYMNIP